MTLPSISQLQHAIQIREQIEHLQSELNSILTGDVVGNGRTAGPRLTAKGKRTMSPEARERIAAAQRARWAKSKGEPMVILGPSVVKPTKKRTMSPEARARIVAAQKKRWAKVRAGKK